MAIVLDSFLGSMLVASYRDAYGMFDQRSVYLHQLSSEDLGGGSVVYGAPERTLVARRGSLLIMGVIALVSALFSLIVIGFLTRSFLRSEDDRLLLQSVFLLSLLIVSGLYRTFPLSDTPLGGSITTFLASWWVGVWGK